MRLFYIFVFLFIYIQTTAQNYDSTYVESKIKNTLILKSRGEYKKAFQVISKLQDELKATKNIFLKGRAVFTKGRIEIDLGAYDDAISSAKKAIKYFTEKKRITDKASAINLVGVAYYFKGNLDSTLVYYNRSFKLKKLNNSGDEQLAITAYNIAIVYEDLGKFDEAIQLYKEAATYLSKTSKNSFLADIYLGISNTYKLKRDFDNANIYGEKALESAIEIYGDDNPNTTFFYVSHASSLKRKGDLKSAKMFLTKAKNIREKSYGENHFWTAETFLNLGEIAMLQKDYLNAEEKLKKAIEISKYSKNNLYGTNAKLYLAQLFFTAKRNTEKAINLTLESLKEFKAVYGENHQDVAECYLLLAKLTRDDKYIKKVLESAKYNTDNLNGIIAPFQTLEAFKYKSTLLKTKPLLQFNLIDSQLEIIRYIKKGFATEKSKILFANNLKEILEENLLVCSNLYTKTQEDKYLKKALELLEVNRNSILLSAIKKKKHKHIFTKEELKKEQELIEQKNKIDFAIHLEQSQKNISKEKLDSLYEKRILVYNKLDNFQQKLLTSYSEYRKLIDLPQSISLEKLKSIINKNQCVISYFLGKKSVFVLIVNADKISFIKLKNTHNLPSLIAKFQKSLTKRTSVKNISKKIYSQLIQPINKSLQNELIIIPDEQLSYIPFEALLDKNNKYLIENNIISYSGSLSLFYEEQTRQKQSFQNPWIGFSPNYKGDEKLATTKNEIENIANLMVGKVFNDKLATINNFKKYYNNSSVLHLAMHTKINQENPQYSELLFYDNALKYSDIYSSKMNADMIVLSACETGYGNIEKGEGVMSLSRAFSYAGIPSTIMSLWKVPDKETSLLMQKFYENLNQGMSKNKALQLTKKNYLKTTKDNELLHPFYWAGFVVNGDTSAIKNRNYNYYLLGTVIFMLILFYFRKPLLKLF